MLDGETAETFAERNFKDADTLAESKRKLLLPQEAFIPCECGFWLETKR